MSRPLNIIVLGSGIAGLGACLALSRFLSDPPTIRIYEVRPQPSTIGGAINLTPNALRCLSHLGVLDVLQSRQCGASISQIAVFSAHTGSSLGKVDFSNSRDGKGPGFGTPPFKAIRITRADLLSALLETISTYPNITLHYSSRAIALSESCSTATVTFADGATASADLVLGCDGIHSAARCFVDPDRTPTYSGVAVAYGFAKGISDLTFPWQDTCLTSSRYGSLMASYYQPDRQNMYVAAVMETDEVGSREGWQVKGADQLKVREDIEMRLSQNHVPGMTELVKRTEDWFLYPVYKLPPKGKWCTDRIMLLGDAAHAVSVRSPPFVWGRSNGRPH
jgi:salicylate hydroxylase